MKCPNCNAELSYDMGTAESWDEPATPATIYCDQCGMDQVDVEKHMWFNVFDMYKTYTDNVAENFDDAVSMIAKLIFKATTCGCVFSANETSVAIAPYVEGFNGDFQGTEFEFPFFMSDFYDELEVLDEIGVKTWECVNTHPDGCDCYLYL